MNNIVIHFEYLKFFDLEDACKTFVGLPIDELKKVLTVYTPLSNSNYSGWEWIVIPQTLIEDYHYIKTSTKRYAQYDEVHKKYTDLYTKLVKEYGQPLVDLFVAPREQVTNSINTCLVFLADAVYKTDIMEVEVKINPDGWENFSNMPNVIYSAIQMNFNIKTQNDSGSYIRLLIERRKDDNVNAN